MRSTAHRIMLAVVFLAAAILLAVRRHWCSVPVQLSGEQMRRYFEEELT